MVQTTVSPAGRWIPGPLPPMDEEVERALYSSTGSGATYVARCFHGGRLIPGTRLSRYFTGPTRSEDAYNERARLRAQYADAEVFHTMSEEAAEVLLATPYP